MKKWLFPVAAAAVVVIGCGGSGGGGGSTSTASGLTAGNGYSIATANIPNTPAQVSITYLTGQGRGVGDTIAYIQIPTIIDAANNAEQPGGVNIPGNGPTTVLDLNGGTLGGTQNTQYLNVLDVPNGNSHQFSTYELIVNSLGTENADGSVSTIAPAAGSNLFAIDEKFPAQIGAFPGRQTNVQVYLNDGMVTVANSVATLDRTGFLSTNTSTFNTNVSGYFSDYVMFDISHVASLPKLTDGTNASRVYFNGDKIGASSATAGGLFQVYTPSVTLTGVWTNPTSLASYGTYALKEVSPTDITQTITITSLQGTWKPYTSVINNPGGFEVMLMPHNADDNEQDVVAFVRDANGNILNLYFGIADLTAKTFTIWSIDQVTTGGTANQLDGTFTSLLDVNGAATTVPANVRSGLYTIGGALPAGFKAAGRFFEYRR